MLKHSSVIHLSELGDVVQTTIYRNIPFRACSDCPMLFIDAENSGNGYCALCGKQLVRGERVPDWCRVVEIQVKESFE